MNSQYPYADYSAIAKILSDPSCNENRSLCRVEERTLIFQLMASGERFPISNLNFTTLLQVDHRGDSKGQAKVILHCRHYKYYSPATLRTRIVQEASNTTYTCNKECLK